MTLGLGFPPIILGIYFFHCSVTKVSFLPSLGHTPPEHMKIPYNT